MDTHTIDRALNALVNVNSKLGRWKFHCKKLEYVVAFYLVSMLLLKYVDDLSIILIYAQLFNYAGIIPE